MHTKEKILRTALHLFAQDGYEAVSVSQIASALGMTKGALYKHYKNKQDIFDQIVVEMERQDAERANGFDLPEDTRQENAEAYRAASLQQLLAFSKAQMRYWTCDAFASEFRRMLTLEQYHNEQMQQLYQQYLGDGPLGYVTDLLLGLSVAHPAQRAVELYAPMFLLYSVYDGAQDKEAVLRLADESLDMVYGTSCTREEKHNEVYSQSSI